MSGQHETLRREEPPERTAGFSWVGLALVTTVALLFLLIVLVVPATHREMTGSQIVLSQFTGVTAFTGMLITGVFVFMAFRVDNGARNVARSEAQAEAKEVSEFVAERTAQRVADEALGQMVRSEVHGYLNSDNGSKAVVDTIVANLDRTVGQLLPGEVRKQIREQLDLRLPDLVAGRLPGLVAERLPTEVASTLPGEVKKALAPELTRQLATALPETVSEQLPAEVKARFEALLEEQIRVIVESMLAELGVTGGEGGERDE